MSSAAFALPARTTGVREAGLGEGFGVSAQSGLVAAVGASGQEDHVRPGGGEFDEVARVEVPGAHVHDPGAGAEPGPVGGAGGHEGPVAE